MGDHHVARAPCFERGAGEVLRLPDEAGGAPPDMGGSRGGSLVTPCGQGKAGPDAAREEFPFSHTPTIYVPSSNSCTASVIDVGDYITSGIVREPQQLGTVIVIGIRVLDRALIPTTGRRRLAPARDILAHHRCLCELPRSGRATCMALRATGAN